ncbi:MAG: tetratricopeptide repeat protein [Acidobacteria bacterium]|nr:tetratricopeptide repeat protein [Acidobacteriota bacterium]
MWNRRVVRYIGFFLILLLLNTGYIWAFAHPTVFYMGNVVIHLALGVLLLLLFVTEWLSNAELRDGTTIPGLLLATAGGLGLYLAVKGNLAPQRSVLHAHIAVAFAAVVLLLPFLARKARQHGEEWASYRTRYLLAALFAVVFPVAAWQYAERFPDPRARIRNPGHPPLSMEGEGGGPKSLFFPSSVQTNVGGAIPSNFFMDSERCADCHKDIYEQWKSSMHHFASFNNQFYRKSIEHMQDVVGTQPSKWCAGCHDHALLFNGRFDKPVKDQIDTPEAQAGLGCMSCHSIVSVDSSMGNGGFTIEYPPLHDLANSKNPYMRKFHDFLTKLDPAPHRAAFIKPFMRQDSSEFCSTCHKVHLDVPVNQYRWIRGFNDYDNWQASGVSGQGARSFYYPPKSSSCTDCHMPLVKSNDMGNKNGFVHQHRFLGANTAVPYVNRDEVQLKTATDFLQSGFVSVDIFAASPVEDAKGQPQMARRSAEGGPQLMSSIAVGEEGEQHGDAFVREVGKVAAPLDQAGVRVKPGSSVRVDVVVRTRRMGHFFPGGTVDAFDVWLELIARDATGRSIFWSGQVEDNGKGAVEPGAHFYKSYQLDGQGNPIDKRNAWQTRSVLYARMIPPGAADVVHYRLDVPQDVQGPITLEAKLNHRKFTHYYTQFSYAGQPQPGQDPSLLSANHNGLLYWFDKANIPQNVSGAIKGEIPVLPITLLAKATAQLMVGNEAYEWKPVVKQQDRERWNDWGIGMLLQGDLKGAEYAFQRVTEAEPGYADGWLNIARALVQEGETDAAKPHLRKALDLQPNLARAHYFQGLVHKADGDYEAALTSLRNTSAQFPRDRVVLNQIARILFLQRKHQEAIDMTKQIAAVDPEDLQMHYTAMLAWRGLGKNGEAAREEKLFRRFKTEESSQSITGERRLASVEENNERQMIHDHTSVKLTPPRPGVGGQ